jgi:hypothetical protein
MVLIDLIGHRSLMGLPVEIYVVPAGEDLGGKLEGEKQAKCKDNRFHRLLIGYTRKVRKLPETERRRKRSGHYPGSRGEAT